MATDPPPPDEMLRETLPRAELERRWALLRSLLHTHDLDALVCQGANTHSGVGGHYRWITGTSVPGSYQRSALFPADGSGMTTVAHGAFDGEMACDPTSARTPGVVRALTTPLLPMVAYTNHYDAACIVADLRRRGARRVGLVAPSTFTHGFGAFLASADGLAWTDLTNAVDTLKAIKSDTEITLMRAAAAMQDRLIGSAAQLIRPGLREYELATELNRLASLAGSLGGFILTASRAMDQDGPPMFPRTAEMQGRRLQAGDFALVLIENAGPGGYVTHIGRLFALGHAPADIIATHDIVMQEQDELAAALRPGAAPAALFAAYNARMRARGLPEEQRLHAHGQGYDIVERPLIRSDETMPLAARMNIGIHPMITTRRILVTAIDNYLVGADGGERLHAAPRGVIELG